MSHACLSPQNSIRHNLSLHNKFLRVHNESTGKSSWWMLNPEGGKTGKAPRRRAASMDNSSKLLKSRMRAKQTKKQAGVAGPGGAGAGLGEGGAGGGDSPGSSQQFSKWAVNSSSPSSRGSLDDPDMWTSFRPRASSDASTLSGRLSPIAPGHEDEDELPEEGLLAGYSAGSSVPPTLTETLMEDLDLIDGLTLMTSQQGGASPSPAPPAPPTPLPSASTLLPRGTGFPSYRPLLPSKPPQPPSQPGVQPSASQGTGAAPGSSSGFGNSLFNPLPAPGSRSSHFGVRVPSSLEALLTSDSPPPSDVMMTQVDPLMPSQGRAGLLGLGGAMAEGRAKSGQLLLGKSMEQSISLQQQQHQQQQHQQQHQQQQAQLGLGMLLPGMGQDPPQMSTLKAQLAQGSGCPAGGGMLLGGGMALAGGNGGLQPMGPFGSPACFLPSQDRLPTDLDIDMFTENLDCDVDYIINSDLMDGDAIDFNFDPIMPGGQSYPGPATTQSSSHNWVPS